ncbi:hypothetical protein L0152_23805 [bacterium]|nr:hypothetical protein [bacterium]
MGKVIRIPVMRYLCRRKGRKQGSPRTFSLLPAEVHPYNRYSSDCSFTVLKETLSRSLTQTLDYFAERLPQLAVATIYRIRRIFEAASMRLKMNGWMPVIRSNLLTEFVECIDGWWEGLPGCKITFYQREGMFLLGTPSQSR